VKVLLQGDGLMEILGTLSRAARTVKSILDLDRGLGDPTLAGQFMELKRQLIEVQNILEETRQISKQQDEVITKLRAAMATKGNMVIDGSAYYVKNRRKVVDGPFCTSCFDRDQEMMRLLNAPKPQGAAGRHLEWVQCPRCQTPFRSRQAGEYLKTRQTIDAGRPAPKPRSRRLDGKGLRATRSDRPRT
jgi:hypothetical protein